jgi:vancomycin resistance protein YoaR
VFFFRVKYANRVYPKVFLFSADLSGKTLDEVLEFLENEQENLNRQKIILTWKEGGERGWEITSQIIDFRFDKDEIIKEAFLKGEGKPSLKWFLETYRLVVAPKVIKPTYCYDAQKLGKIFSQIDSEIRRPAKEALFEFEEGKVTSFQISEEGRELDQAEGEYLVFSSFSQYPFRETIELTLPVKKVFPKVATSQSNQLGIVQLLAVGESFFMDSIPSRVHNIILASSKFHGIVIPPGETFSFAKYLGEVSSKAGYQQAYVIKEKKTVLEDGGGVCQVSTTFFRAALNAGLPIIERQPHYYRVGFYEQGGYPPGLDATVYPPSPDFKFLNDTPAHLLVQTRIDKEKKRLAFELYGTYDDRRVNLTKPTIHSTSPPPPPIYTDDPTLKAGVVKRVDYGHWGAKVSFKRQVFLANGDLKEEKVFWSNYVPWPASYLRGTKVQ